MIRMRLCRIFAAILISAIAQAAPLQNLGFDDANTSSLTPVPVPGGPNPGFGPATDLLPHWSIYRGEERIDTIGHNLAALNPGILTLISPDYSGFLPPFPVEGEFALYLDYDVRSSSPFSLVQEGGIFEGAQWLTYRYAGDLFDVSINGLSLRPFAIVDMSDEAKLASYDISNFAGQEVTLTLSTPPLSPETSVGTHYLDSMALVIPEPSSMQLFGMVATIVGAWSLAAKNRRKLG